MNTQQQISTTQTQLKQALSRLCELESNFQIYEGMDEQLRGLRDMAEAVETTVANLLKDLGG